MCFSIRPTEVKRFRTVLRCDVDLSLRVLASLRNRPHRPFHDGIRRTKWNNLQGVLCAHEAQGTAHAPSSLRPSSREGQLSASSRNRKLLLLVRSSITGLFALSRLHFPCPAEIRAAHPDAMQDDRQPPGQGDDCLLYPATRRHFHCPCFQPRPFGRPCQHYLSRLWLLQNADHVYHQPEAQHLTFSEGHRPAEYPIFKMNSPPTSRVGKPGCPAPGVQTLANRPSRNVQSISRASRTSG